MCRQYVNNVTLIHVDRSAEECCLQAVGGDQLIRTDGQCNDKQLKNETNQLHCEREMSRQCLDGIQTMSRPCLDNVQTMSRQSIDDVQRVSRQCLWQPNVQTMSRRCLDNIQKVSMVIRIQKCRVQVFLYIVFQWARHFE